MAKLRSDFIVFAIYQLIQYGLGIASTHRDCLRCEGSDRIPKQLKR